MKRTLTAIKRETIKQLGKVRSNVVEIGATYDETQALEKHLREMTKTMPDIIRGSKQWEAVRKTFFDLKDLVWAMNRSKKAVDRLLSKADKALAHEADLTKVHKSAVAMAKVTDRMKKDAKRFDNEVEKAVAEFTRMDKRLDEQLAELQAELKYREQEDSTKK